MDACVLLCLIGKKRNNPCQQWPVLFGERKRRGQPAKKHICCTAPQQNISACQLQLLQISTEFRLHSSRKNRRVMNLSRESFLAYQIVCLTKCINLLTVQVILIIYIHFHKMRINWMPLLSDYGCLLRILHFYQ